MSEEERAAFVPHEVFDCDYADIAATLDKSEAACRQLVHRARERVAVERRRFRVDDAAREEILRKFIAVAANGDFEALKALFAPDARMTSDGGGKALAVFRVLEGANRIARFWYAIRRFRGVVPERRIVRINGELGIALFWAGRLHSVSAIDTDGAHIFNYYSIVNPDKLAAFKAVLAHDMVTTGVPRAS